MNAFFRKTLNRDQAETKAAEPAVAAGLGTAPPERLQRAAESILENEALTADLDDDAAQVLLDWGIALAQQIADGTALLEEAAAEEAMYLPLRVLRKMLRQVNRWAAAPETSGLEEILESAAATYGPRFVAPDAALSAQFLDQIPAGEKNLAEKIRQLRYFIENQCRSG